MVRPCEVSRVLVAGAFILAASLLPACESENTKGVAISSSAQKLREQAGLHPVDKRPVIGVGDGGLRRADDPKLREKAGLTPVRPEDQPKTPQEMREQVDLQPNRKPPPANEAEMRERMDLHPERVEEK